MTKPETIELLAPARDAATAFEAIKHGADAVYMGASSHGARSAACNALDDVKRTVDFAHQFGARVYITVNTLVLDSEIAEVERLIRQLYQAKVDAIIAQDMGILRMDIPPIALHASTQCDIRTPEKARFLADAGFSQLVLARELTLDETAAIHRAIPHTPLEAFVHGALCVSYSGDCQAGYAITRRSANRGECPQICRLPYDLTDGNGRTVVRGKHLLSLRDLNRSTHLSGMLEAGITSFKIEGRLKDTGYVKNVTAYYRSLLDNIIAQNPQRYRRSSFGRSEITFTPDLNESFNRGFTSYFTTAPRPEVKMATFDSPKWCGTKVGTAVRCDGTRLRAKLDTELSNGDGLGYFDASGHFCGFRVNRVDGNLLHLQSPQTIAPGTALMRNHNKRRADSLSGETATRKIEVAMTLRTIPAGIALDVTDERGAYATATLEIDADDARSPQLDRRKATLGKTGDTIYRVGTIDDRAGNLFIPAAQLTSLRRKALDALERSWLASYRYDYRRSENPAAEAPAQLTYHDNVANEPAREFYTDHGAKDIAPALECSRTLPSPDKPLRVMTTRYCLRREIGACLRTAGGKKLKAPLTLTSGTTRLHAEFDCKQCRMSLFFIAKDNGFL